MSLSKFKEMYVLFKQAIQQCDRSLERYAWNMMSHYSRKCDGLVRHITGSIMMNINAVHPWRPAQWEFAKRMRVTHPNCNKRLNWEKGRQEAKRLAIKRENAPFLFVGLNGYVVFEDGRRIYVNEDVLRRLAPDVARKNQLRKMYQDMAREILSEEIRLHRFAGSPRAVFAREMTFFFFPDHSEVRIRRDDPRISELRTIPHLIG